MPRVGLVIREIAFSEEEKADDCSLLLSHRVKYVLKQQTDLLKHRVINKSQYKHENQTYIHVHWAFLNT